ncbi:uncharacterized protein PG986_014309 [Apiospora aurea]|uniref:Uncharacterized protein n=1 Tax=Apiospora aurea TaxID=335848 RepID=A0ABR1PSL7_9PEZI
MCTAGKITIDTADEADALYIMTLPQTNDRTYRLEADQSPSCFEFPYPGLSLELEWPDGGSIRSTLPPWTEDQAAYFFSSDAVSPETPLPSECLNGSNLGGSVLDDMLHFMEPNPAECGDMWWKAWDELVEVGFEHDGTANDDTAQARPLSPGSPYIPSLVGADLVKGYLPAQDDPEDSDSVETSLPREQRAWSPPDPAVPMPMEEAASELPEAGLSRTPCRDRRARPTDSPGTCKRARGCPDGSRQHKLPVRLVKVVVSNITPVAQHFRWKRRRTLWCEDNGQETWSREDLSIYVLAGLPFLSLVVQPGGYGYAVTLVWDEKSERFSGYNAMNGKWVRITCEEMVRMLENPEVGV